MICGMWLCLSNRLILDTLDCHLQTHIVVGCIYSLTGYCFFCMQCFFRWYFIHLLCITFSFFIASGKCLLIGLPQYLPFNNRWPFILCFGFFFYFFYIIYVFVSSFKWIFILNERVFVLHRDRRDLMEWRYVYAHWNLFIQFSCRFTLNLTKRYGNKRFEQIILENYSNFQEFTYFKINVNIAKS